MSQPFFFPANFMFIMVLFIITPEKGPLGTTRSVMAPILSTSALLSTQFYIETKFARITQTFEKSEHFRDQHVLGRMEITRFQTVTCGDFQIALYSRHFVRTCPSRFKGERYHYGETLKRTTELLATFSICDILGAKSSCFPD